jgi:DNA-binding NarL/FixJ family response regulator
MLMKPGSGPGRRRRAPATSKAARHGPPFTRNGARRLASVAARGELEQLLRACLRRLRYATTAVAATADGSRAVARAHRTGATSSLVVMVSRFPQGAVPPLTLYLGSAPPTARRPPAPPAPLSPGGPSLTRRQRDVLQFVAQGWTSKRIARELAISPRTVEAHRANLMARLGVQSAAGLVAEAARRGLLGGEGESHVGI